MVDIQESNWEMTQKIFIHGQIPGAFSMQEECHDGAFKVVTVSFVLVPLLPLFFSLSLWVNVFLGSPALVC